MTRTGETKNAYRVFVGKPEGRRQLEKHRHRWVIIKIDLTEAGWKNVGGIHLSQARNNRRALVHMVTKLPIP